MADASLFGATGRTRTGDLLITNQLLYQLSYSSVALLNADDMIAQFPGGVKAEIFRPGGVYMQGGTDITESIPAESPSFSAL